MKVIQEFREFAVRGNVVDMAVGIIIGAAFGKIVTVLVSDLAVVVKEAVGTAPAVVVGYGKFVQTVIDFTIVAFAVFMLVKGVNTLKKREEAAPVAPKATAEELLLVEIRDLLKQGIPQKPIQ
jgi:large conductance mechanosensitive channel